MLDLILGGLLLMMGRPLGSVVLLLSSGRSSSRDSSARLIEEHISFAFARERPKQSYSETGRPPEWGCDSPLHARVTEIDPDGDYLRIFPCFDFPTLADNVDNRGLSWNYYAVPDPQWGYAYSAFDAISHIRNSGLWSTNVVNPTEFLSDAMNGNLASVSWLIHRHFLGLG